MMSIFHGCIEAAVKHGAKFYPVYNIHESWHFQGDEIGGHYGYPTKDVAALVYCRLHGVDPADRGDE